MLGFTGILVLGGGAFSSINGSVFDAGTGAGGRAHMAATADNTGDPLGDIGRAKGKLKRPSSLMVAPGYL
jgi:hypothetical protein